MILLAIVIFASAVALLHGGSSPAENQAYGQPTTVGADHKMTPWDLCKGRMGRAQRNFVLPDND